MIIMTDFTFIWLVSCHCVQEQCCAARLGPGLTAGGELLEGVGDFQGGSVGPGAMADLLLAQQWQGHFRAEGAQDLQR